MFEIFTVFVPVFQVIRLRILSKKAKDTNSRWETGSQTTTLRSSTSAEWQKTSSVSLVEKGQSLDYLDEKLGDRLLTMAALDTSWARTRDPCRSSLRCATFPEKTLPS